MKGEYVRSDCSLHGRLIGSASLALYLSCLILCEGTRADTDDMAMAFVEGLRERGWHDVVLEYLDRADRDPLATQAFLDRVSYERAVTQTALAGETTNEKQRTAVLDQAIRGFQRYAETHSNSALSLDALNQIGRVLNQRALYALSRSDRLPATAQGQREQLQQQARDSFDSARKSLEDLIESCSRMEASLPKAAQAQKQPPGHPRRQALQAQQAEAEFSLAKILFESSRTYPVDSKGRSQALEQAAEAFKKLFEDYDQKLVGFFGRLYEGRCYQTLDKTEQALDCFEDLIDQPISIPSFRRLVARAYRHRAEIHLANGKFDKSIEETSECLRESRGLELQQPEWLAVAFQLAKAYQAKAADSSAGDNARKLKSESQKLLRNIARHPGEFQRQAKGELASGSADGGLPAVAKTFDEAFAAGKTSLERMNSAKLAAKLALENNPDAVENLRQQAASHQTASINYFQTAVRLGDTDDHLEELIELRYFLCWLYWEDDRLHEAAVVGEFLARSYPDSKYAAMAAKVALAAFERLYNQARSADTAGAEFEAGKLNDIAELMVLRWPDSPEGSAAMNLLINIAIRDDRIADAEALLEQLPASSRASAELTLGSSLWTRYLRSSAGGGSGSVGNKVSDVSITTLKERAGDLLSRGFEATRSKTNPSTAEATGILYFVQWLLAHDRIDQAVAVLEDEQVGPLSLVEKVTSAGAQSEFAQEAYKAALRAYVSLEPPERNKARAMMDELESTLGKAGNSQQQLTSIYVSLGLQLQRQINELSAAGNTSKARNVAAAFGDLLKRVTSGSDGNDWKVQSWIAQTNLQLGRGLRGEDAASYFEQAEKACRALLAAAEKDPDFAPSKTAVLRVRKRLGDCLLAKQEFEAALEQYTSILKEKPSMLELQQVSALVLQQWGTESKVIQKIELAIRGTLPQAGGKNLVWGWVRLATIADQAKRRATQRKNSANVSRYTDLFFEARFNAAKARFAASQISVGALRQKHLETARRSVKSMQQLYPNLGGPKWQKAFAELLKQME